LHAQVIGMNTITIAPDDVSRGHCDQAPRANWMAS
jgi:hypothetical protein